MLTWHLAPPPSPRAARIAALPKPNRRRRRKGARKVIGANGVPTEEEEAEPIRAANFAGVLYEFEADACAAVIEFAMKRIARVVCERLSVFDVHNRRDDVNTDIV